jgi:hypothetical protein
MSDLVFHIRHPTSPIHHPPSFSFVVGFFGQSPVLADVGEFEVVVGEAGGGVDAEVGEGGGALGSLADVKRFDLDGEAGGGVDPDVDVGELAGEAGAVSGGKAELGEVGVGAFGVLVEGFDVELLVDFGGLLADGEGEGAFAEAEEVEFFTGAEDLAADLDFFAVAAVGEPGVVEEVFELVGAGAIAFVAGEEQDAEACVAGGGGAEVVPDFAGAGGGEAGGGVDVGEGDVGIEVDEVAAAFVEELEEGLDFGGGLCGGGRGLDLGLGSRGGILGGSGLDE